MKWKAKTPTSHQLWDKLIQKEFAFLPTRAMSEETLMYKLGTGE